MTRVLITGSEGFIGTHLKEHLLSTGGYELSLFDIKLNCFQDVRDAAAVRAFIASEKPNVIIHLAANPDITRSVHYPHPDLELNVGGTINVLEAIRDSPVDLFILASTAQVYGEPQQEKMDENHPISPKSPYAIGKYTAERYCLFYQQTYNIPVTIFRFFNVYGPDQPDNVVVPSLLRKISAAQGRLDMFGSKEDSRDFLYVKDICEAIELAVRKKPVGEIINLGSGKETTIYDLARTIAEILGKSIEFSYSDAVGAGKISRLCAQPEKARRILSWKARTELREGVVAVAKKAGYL